MFHDAEVFLSAMRLSLVRHSCIPLHLFAGRHVLCISYTGPQILLIFATRPIHLQLYLRKNHQHICFRKSLAHALKYLHFSIKAVSTAMKLRISISNMGRYKWINSAHLTNSPASSLAVPHFVRDRNMTWKL